MVDKKTITASALTGVGVATVALILSLFSGAGDNPIGYCEDTNEFCVAVEGFSGGQQTRCYNATDMNWWDAPYCKEGWQIVNNDLKINQPKEQEKEPIEDEKELITKGLYDNKNRQQVVCYPPPNSTCVDVVI